VTITVGDRRTALRWAVAAALAPMLATRAGAAASGGGGRIHPPLGPMTFTRRLERGLAGGANLVVARSFAVRFGAAVGGWTITGEQVDVAVEAPERIAALAAIERQRKETGLFPLTLDRSGMIVGAPDAPRTKEVDQALALVRSELAKRNLAADERREYERFVRAVHDAGAKMSSALPADLFAPRERTTHAQRELALPGGGAGTIEISFTAEVDPATGVMRQARRDIVTAIADDRRLTREDWSLLPD
jgi:hypothetical protein